MSLSEYLNTYQIEAFRIEVLPEYHVIEEKDALQSFLETKKLEISSDLKNYLSIHENKIAEGKKHIRARVVPNPITNYFIFETKVGYSNASKIGIELFFMDQQEFDFFKKTYSKYDLNDFWLFDKNTLIKMNYDHLGTFLGITKSINPEEVEVARRIRNVFLEKGKSLNQLISEHSILQ